jgi:hypothetical protein
MLNTEASCSKNLYKVSKMEGTLCIINNVIWMLVYSFLFLFSIFESLSIHECVSKIQMSWNFSKRLRVLRCLSMFLGSLRC